MMKSPPQAQPASEGAATLASPEYNRPGDVLSRIQRLLRSPGAVWMRRRLFAAVLLAIIVAAAITHTNLFVSGLILGTTLGLGALGLTLTYGILKFPNLGHGMTMILAGYVAFFMYNGIVRQSASSIVDVTVPWNLGALPQASSRFLGLSFGYGFVLALAVAVLFAIGLSLFFDWAVYQRLRRRRQTAGLMLTIVSFGVTFVLVGIIDSVWGLTPRNITQGITLAHHYAFGITLSSDQLLVFVVDAVLTASVAFFLYRTRLGRMMRAMSDNPDLARVSGINVEQVIRYHWVLVGAVIGLSGTLLGLVSPLSPQLGLSLLLPLFAAAAVGGVGNPLGALIGGLVIGITEQVSVAFINPEYEVGVAFLLLVFVLLFRPSGLLGTRA